MTGMGGIFAKQKKKGAPMNVSEFERQLQFKNLLAQAECLELVAEFPIHGPSRVKERQNQLSS
jgi:hypothetical protein